MVPWKRRRKRPFGFFDDFFSDDFFGDMDEDFRQMEENIARILDELRKGVPKGEVKPYVYGFSMRVGPDGKPHIEEFGNVPGAKGQIGQISDEREPLTDVIDGDEEISVIAELPGIGKEDIKLEATEENLTIKVDTPDRKYFKEMELPSKIKPETTKANYKNGVLEVKIKRAKKKEKKKGTEIRVE